MIVGHPIDVQIFHTDHPETVYNLSAFLMGEVITSERYPLVNTRYCLTVLLALRCPFGKFGVCALHFGKCLLFLAKEARVGYLFTCGKPNKRFQSDINAHLGRCWFKAFRLTLNRKADIPLASTASLDATGLDLP